MITLRHPISYEWERRHTLSAWRKGLRRREELCDADFILRTAAKFHGHIRSQACPICERPELYEVCWVYGDNLGQANGSARSGEELELLLRAKPGHSCTVHTVEVCVYCHWNHLLEIATATWHETIEDVE
ncbi:MAG: DUF5318 family protein [Corynebacterium sp.]|nr:DUF5318 family protein [Corynebacterium sp.]